MSLDRTKLRESQASAALSAAELPTPVPSERPEAA